MEYTRYDKSQVSKSLRQNRLVSWPLIIYQKPLRNTSKINWRKTKEQSISAMRNVWKRAASLSCCGGKRLGASSYPLLLKWVSVCLFLYGTPQGCLADYDWQNYFGMHPTWHRSVSKSLAPASDFLIDFGDTDYAGDSTCQFRVTWPITKRRQLSDGSGAWNWSFLHDCLSKNQDN